MKKTIYAKLLFACGILCMLASCSKEDMSTDQIYSEADHAEMYLNSHDVPAIMFSYNILNTDTKVLNSFLIDDEGQIRTNTTQAFEIREITINSKARLQAMKDNAKLIENQSVTIEELVQNFNLMRTAQRLQYDTSVEKEGPQILTTAYAYYYDYAQANNDRNECGGGDTGSGAGTTGSFRALLLEQKLGSEIIQKNETAIWTINWLNDIVNNSALELENS